MTLFGLIRGQGESSLVRLTWGLILEYHDGNLEDERNCLWLSPNLPVLGPQVEGDWMLCLYGLAPGVLSAQRCLVT